MKKFKKIIGWIIIVNILPIMLALTTLDGKLCVRDRCTDVMPFWEGYGHGLFIMAILILINNLVTKYLFEWL